MTGGLRSWDSVSNQAMYRELGHFPFLPIGKVLQGRKRRQMKNYQEAFPAQPPQLMTCFLNSNFVYGVLHHSFFLATLRTISHSP